MKHLTLDEFLQWCEDNPDKSHWDCEDTQDTETSIFNSLYLWRQSLEANSSKIWPRGAVTGTRMLNRYNTLLNLFGPEINNDLNQFYNDNKD